MELITRLQEVDPEKLSELCRMHLSFALDLPDDEFATLLSARNETKNRWCYFGRKNREKSSADTGLTYESISQIYQIIEFLGRDINIDHEGLFRKSGSLSRQQELKALLSAGATIDFSLGHYTIDDCASVMKNFLSELPEPLLTEAHYFAHCQIAEMMKEDMTPIQKEHVYQRQLKSVRLLLLLLPQEYYCLLKYLLLLLSQVKVSHERNKMTSENLATVFAPQILCPRKMSPEDLKNSFPRMAKVVSFLIDNALQLFEPPIELVHDVSLYLREISRGEFVPNGCETTPVKTTVAFCERSNLEGANPGDYTKKALKELHSYIQNLPNSARKRKLIKKFNNENPGTNENLSRRKHFRSRSVGEAIKKHFWKSSSKETYKSYHHSSYEMLSADSGLQYGHSSKAKSVEALNLERLNNSSKVGPHGSNWLRASKKFKALKF